ncbi:MAG: DUF1800 domain-containing protein [Pseudomonadota bacterium]
MKHNPCFAASLINGCWLSAVLLITACGGGSSSKPTLPGASSVASAAHNSPASSMISSSSINGSAAQSSSTGSVAVSQKVLAPDLTADPELPAKGTDAHAKAAEAVRFLTQATFGPTLKEIDHLTLVGKEAWLEEQFVEPKNLHLELLLKRYEQVSLVPVPTKDIDTEAWQREVQRSDIFWEINIWGKDQLRQRVAYALSQILVISNVADALFNDSRGIAHYNDILASHAFGNYRDLLEEVTLNPMMGEYLNMVRNEKANAEKNIRPDENFARELMQLFSIGLVELNLDGTVKLDDKNLPIPTYDQNTIKALARVFTGWNLATITNWWEWTDSGASEILPMKAFPAYHDTAEKILFGNKIISAGKTPQQDIDAALDILFAHNNIAPFISKQLIQRLVTSNPSSAYVSRVASIFNDNGMGVKGDLKAVIKAILLDDEAQNGYKTMPDTFGKLREPILQFSAIWRAFHAQGVPAKNAAGYISPPRLRFYGTGREMGQRPFGSNSVFNFYRPDYQQPGAIKTANLVSPEFQILTESFTVAKTNAMTWFSFWTDSSNTSFAKDFDADWDLFPPRMNFNKAKALAAQRAQLIDYLNLLLMANQMSAEMQQILLTYLNSLPVSNNIEKEIMVYEALFLVAASPEYAVQR